jgi:ELP3 family radical SAM enzyme/protein acetyltransferase
MSSCSSPSYSSPPPEADLEDVAGDPVLPDLCERIVRDLLEVPQENIKTTNGYSKTMLTLARKHRVTISKRNLGMTYRRLKAAGLVEGSVALDRVLITRAVRSESGILNISVSLPPDRFSCKYNCHFCPNEPGMPRSYLSNEDVFRRAAHVGFDTVRQVWNRLEVLEDNGHPIDKLEYRVLGGTFSCYDHAITDEFVRDLYYAANTYFERALGADKQRVRGTIEHEQLLNTYARVHCVGIGIETRPDEITRDEVLRLRRYGVTRVETGIQHTDDAVLRKVNRGHLTKHSVAAVKLLKDYGFKVEMHIMADLPGATPDSDRACYERVLTGEDLIPDYLKDYPCLDVNFTKIREWREEGKWQPYAELNEGKDLQDVLVYRQQITPPWVRVNRVQRDFHHVADQDGLGYVSETHSSNLSQKVHRLAEERGIYCQCIRCCEVRDEDFRAEDVTFRIHEFRASGVDEAFICAIVPGCSGALKRRRPLMLGFARVRAPSAELLNTSLFESLKGLTAMIRELHVYGRVKEVGSGAGDVAGQAQHLGLGRKLMERAETWCRKKGAEKVAVIAGIGVRDYYRRLGYQQSDTYMVKTLPPNLRGMCALLVSICLVTMLYIYILL